MASIDRIKTEVYFTDASGVEWKVTDTRRRSDGRLWKQYPGCPDAPNSGISSCIGRATD